MVALKPWQFQYNLKFSSAPLAPSISYAMLFGGSMLCYAFWARGGIAMEVQGAGGGGALPLGPHGDCHTCSHARCWGECLPGAHPARYF